MEREGILLFSLKQNVSYQNAKGFVVDYLRASYFMGLEAQFLLSYFGESVKNKDSFLMDFSNRNVGDLEKEVLSLYKEKSRNIDGEELIHQSYIYSYETIVAGGGENNDITFRVLDLLDVGKALYTIGNYVGAYSLDFLDKYIRH